MAEVPIDQVYISATLGAFVMGAFALIARIFNRLDKSRDDAEIIAGKVRQDLREHMDTERYDQAGRERVSETFRKEVQAKLDSMDIRSQSKLEIMDSAQHAAHQRQADMIAVVTEKVASKPSREDMRSELMSIQENILARMTIDRRNSQGD